MTAMIASIISAAFLLLALLHAIASLSDQRQRTLDNLGSHLLRNRLARK